MRPVEPIAREATMLATLAADPPRASGRPAVRLCMVQSVDGVAAVDGTSGPLGTPADREFFLACRSLADILLVGAGTARAEGYGPARLTPELIAARRERGQADLPPIAVVSRTLDLDLRAPFFTAAAARPIVVTCAAAPRRELDAITRMADVVVAGDRRVDLGAALADLGRSGARLVGCEGGPSLNGELLRAGLVDEVCLSVSPLIVGSGPRVVAGGGPIVPLTLHDAFRDGDSLFMRLRPRTASEPR